MPASALRQSEAGVEMKRSPCPVCKRRFPEDRLKVHEDICRNISKKRPVYNATAHRLNGVATDQEIKKIIREKTKPTKLSTIPWRESHVNWNPGEDTKDKRGSRKQTATSSDGRVLCKGCNRRFAPDVAEKHCPGCEERNRH
uniref:UPF0418 protein T03G11.3 n=1 Tax=Lygus hesperus TaxID=30085 RepID=A0A0A9WZ17_LYGHE